MPEFGCKVMALVKNIVAEELDMEPDDVTLQLGLYQHPLWDSIMHVGILLRLEKEGGLILDDQSTDTLNNVEQIVDRIRAGQ